MKKLALVLLLCLLAPAWSAPPTADRAEDVVHLLLDGKDDAAYDWLSAPRQKDTSKDAFKALLHRVRGSLGTVTHLERLQKHEAPIGAIMGMPTPEVQNKEDEQYKNEVYDTLWLIHANDRKTYLLLTFVAENKRPKVLWMIFIGDSLRTPEYAQVEKQARPPAEAFIDAVRKDQREQILAHQLSADFAKRMPRDHMFQLFEQVKQRIGAVGGVSYTGGWVTTSPPGITVVFKQPKPPPKTDPYTVLVRLVKEGTAYKVDAVADLGHGAENK